MSVLLLIAGLVILIAVVLVAAGRGGELPAERADYAPLDLGPASATDVALLRPPTNAWGYNMQATDEAMAQIAASIRDRDIRIVALEQLVTDLSREPAPPPLTSPYVGARRRALPGRRQARPAAGNGPSVPYLVPLSAPGGRGPSARDRAPGREHWSPETAWSRESASPGEPGWPAAATRPDMPVLAPGRAPSPRPDPRPKRRHRPARVKWGRRSGPMAEPAAREAVAGPDGRLRCPWGLSSPDYVAYHDTEWGRPVQGDKVIFERLSLEAFQSGLSWLTILRKRENFRPAFAGFDLAAVAAFGEADVPRLLADAAIVGTGRRSAPRSTTPGPPSSSEG